MYFFLAMVNAQCLSERIIFGGYDFDKCDNTHNSSIYHSMSVNNTKMRPSSLGWLLEFIEPTLCKKYLKK